MVKTQVANTKVRFCSSRIAGFIRGLEL